MRRSPTLIAILDVAILAAVVLCASATLGGPIDLQLLRAWSINWVTSGLGAVALVAVRVWLRPSPSVFKDWSRRVRDWWRLPATRGSLRAVVVTRAAVFLAGWIAVMTLGPGAGPPPDREIASLPGRWDASWYLGVAAGGYRWVPGERNLRLAFFPGYPVTLRVVASVLHLPDSENAWLWTGVALSLALFWAALFFLHRLAEGLVGDAAATRAMWLLACYPFSLFYGQLYSESLFLLAAIASCYFMRTDRPGLSGVAGMVVGLVRPTGCLIALAVGWEAWIVRVRASLTARRTIVTIAAIGAPAVGLLAYVLYIRHLTGDALAWMTVQSNWGRAPRSPILLVTDVIGYMRAHGIAAYVRDRPYDCANAAAAIFALAGVVPVARRLGLGFALFVLLSVAIPLTAGGWLSIGRFTSVLFPLFIWLGAASSRTRPIAIAWLVIECVLAALFFTDRPVF